MSKRKIGILTRIKYFFMAFNMCKCAEPNYEVRKGVLHCNLCEKPVKWKK